MVLYKKEFQHGHMLEPFLHFHVAKIYFKSMRVKQKEMLCNTFDRERA